MSDYTLTIKADEKIGVLDDITDVITDHGAYVTIVMISVQYFHCMDKKELYIQVV